MKCGEDDDDMLSRVGVEIVSGQGAIWTQDCDSGQGVVISSSERSPKLISS